MTRPYQEAIQIFVTETLIGDKSGPRIGTSDDLLTTELIDSIGIMQLVAFIERESGLPVPPEDVTFENFLTIDAICDFLGQLADRPVEPSPASR